MEIGALFILGIISLSVCFTETKLGQKIAYFLAKKFCNVDINELEED